MKLYVEGGGDASMLRTLCRAGFSAFLKKAGLEGSMPRIVACGGRQDAYDSFCTAVKMGAAAMLLVDSEAPVDKGHQIGKSDTWQPWAHLAKREGDQWPKPENTEDCQCHLMVECMESWFLADTTTLSSFFGQGFLGNSLPTVTQGIEGIAKQQVYDALAKATAHCKTKAPYGKGEHSFRILALIGSKDVMAKSPWADRFVTALKKSMGAER